jgi:hypothetical protein
MRRSRAQHGIHHRAFRDRRDRGLRSPLLHPGLPKHRTRTQWFDGVVLDAFAEIDSLWHEKLTGLDLAVDEVPGLLPKDPTNYTWPDDVTADGPIPLARLIPAGIDRRGDRTRARLVLFRRPILRRSRSEEDLADLLLAMLAKQVGEYLGLTEEIVLRGPE